MKSTVIACANLALIKYWGNINDELNIPQNDSISVSLEKLTTTTSVEFGNDLDDTLILNEKAITGLAKQRFEKVLHRFRTITNLEEPAYVVSENNFPTAAGIASSASGFGALAHALLEASNHNYSSQDVSRLARLGSGSAARTYFPGYVHWKSGNDDSTSFAKQIAHPNDLRILVVITTSREKPISSTMAMKLSKKHSPFYLKRSEVSNSNIQPMINAIRSWDINIIGKITQQEANNLHAVINTTKMGLSYWNKNTIEIIKLVKNLQKEDIPCYYTMDAGPQVKIIVEPKYSNLVKNEIQMIEDIEDIIDTGVGFGSKVISSN